LQGKSVAGKIKGPFKGKRVVIQRDFYNGARSDSRSSSETGVEERQPKITYQALLL